MLKVFLITNNPEIAAYASASGVDRIMVDLELLGKHERQGHLSTVISNHTLADIKAIRPHIEKGSLMVRINPIHSETSQEINSVIEAGADVIMLPMFKTPDEVEIFTKNIKNRAKTCLLVETVGAMNSLEECISIEGVDEIHIGLNDLHLELGSHFMFEPLVNGLVDKMANTLRDAGKPFGIGGIARVGEGKLPAELIIAEHAKLGSTAAILSRTFHGQANSVSDIKMKMDFPKEVVKLKQTYVNSLEFSSEELNEIRKEIKCRIQQIIHK